MKILIETYDLKQNYGISATTVMKMVVADLSIQSRRSCLRNELATIVHALQGTSVGITYWRKIVYFRYASTEYLNIRMQMEIRLERVG